MANLGKIRIDAEHIAEANLSVVIKLQHAHRLTLRIWLAQRIIRVAFWVLPGSHRLEAE